MREDEYEYRPGLCHHLEGPFLQLFAISKDGLVTSIFILYPCDTCHIMIYKASYLFP